MTEFFLDDYRIEVKANEIRQTFQNNKLGDVSTRQLNYTNTFKAYHTISNEAFFGFLNEINTTSNKPYRFMRAKIVVDGLELNIGTAYVKKSNEQYVEIYVYSGVNGLYEAINTLSIRDLDWNPINHTLTQAIAQDSFDGSMPYIYAISNQTNKLDQNSNLETWLPSVFEHYIFDKIITEAGFSYEGDLFDTDSFKKPVINPVTYDENETNFKIKDFSAFMPDILQSDFLREILFRYGLMFDKPRGTTNLVFKQMKEIFRDRENAIDWSEKYAGEGDTSFVLGKYAKRNYFRYADKEGYSKNADGFFELDVDNLNQQVTVARSSYTVNQQVNVFDDLVFPIFIFDDDGNVSISEVDESISTIEYKDSGVNFTDETGIIGSFNGQVPFLRFNDLNWSKFTRENYQELQKIANRAKVIDMRIFLDPIDIYNLDFFKLVYIQSKSSFFYINKISNFINGRVTTCQMVRIPPNVFADNTVTNTAPIVELFVDKPVINQGDTVKFTHNIVDNENNIEKWELIFDGFQNVSGFGLPPSFIEYTYNNPGSFNPILIVTDFEDEVGTGSVAVQVDDTFIVTFDASTGEYNAPAGSTVTVFVQIGGSGDAEGLITAGTLDAGFAQAGSSDLGTRQVALNIPSSSRPKMGQIVFVMPSNGVAWFKGYQFVGPSGPSQNFTSASISNNGETVGFAVNNAGDGTTNTFP